jgi:ubiquinone/menaquinone biosynthesis C-methylase UbiE
MRVIPGASLPGSFFVANLWWYGLTVLRPTQALKRRGLYRGREIGRYPEPAGRAGGGPYYSRLYTSPVLLNHRPAGYETVIAFDQLSAVHDDLQKPFSAPVFEEVTRMLAPLADSRSRVLDCSCGGGTEALALAACVLEGEVVGADLAVAMVSTAAERANHQGIRNVAFFQADVANLSHHFEEPFDFVYCSFSFHHYTEPVKALVEMRRVLAPGGHAFVVDAGPWWMKALGSPIARWADPGWVAFYTGEEFQDLFAAAGFSCFYWTELLPGIGLCVGTR